MFNQIYRQNKIKILNGIGTYNIDIGMIPCATAFGGTIIDWGFPI